MALLDDLRDAQEVIARHLRGAQPERVRAADAAELVRLFAGVERLCAAGKVVYSQRAAQSTTWRDEGHRSPAAWMAKTTGCGMGEAVSLLEQSAALGALPATADALRGGTLSAPQLRIITEAAPTRACDEKALLLAAAGTTMKGLKEKSAQVRQATASRQEAETRAAAIRAGRSVRHWCAPDGAFRLDARLTPDAGAQLMAALSAETDARFRRARRAEDREPSTAYMADALVALVTGTGITAPVDDGRRPRSTVVFRVDASAFRRGHAKPGEICEVPGLGPVPVAAVRRQLSDAFVKILVADGADVTTVCHVGRSVPARLQSALEERDPCCVVPGCDTALGLENHHWRVPYAECGTSTLAGLARVCSWHHDLLTYDGYVLAGGPGGWEMRAPPGGGGFDTS